MGLWIGLALSATAQSQSVVGFQLYPTPTVGSNPHGIAAGPDGTLWFTESAANRIGRITTSGAFTEYPLPTPRSEPESMVRGADGNLWFTEPGTSQLGRITPDGTITEFSLPTPNSTPWNIAAGPDGALWFTASTAHAIGRMTTNGIATEFALSPLAAPRGITVGPDGNLWFTESYDFTTIYGSDKIGRITPSGAITEFAPASIHESATNPLVYVNGPDGITAGQDGRLWFRNGQGIAAITTSGVIGSFSYPYTGFGPNGSIAATDASAWPAAFALSSSIVTGPDGALWYPCSGFTTLARMIPGAAPSTSADPAVYQTIAYWIVTGPDGAMWFTAEYQQNSSSPIVSAIGRATLMTVAPATLPAANVGAAYSQSLTITGGTSPYTWSASGLPPGLSLSNDGTLSGTPTAAGSYTPQLVVRDSSTPPVTVEVNYTLDSEQLTLTPAALPPVAGGLRYGIDQQFTVSGGTPPYVWKLADIPSLMSSNTIDIGIREKTGSSGYLVGTLPSAGDFPLIVSVTDSSTPPLSATRALRLSVMAAVGGLNYAWKGVLWFNTGDPYSLILQSAGGTPPYTWSATGLPPGMSITKDGVLSGPAQSTGHYPWTLTVQDSSTPPVVSNSLWEFDVFQSTLAIATPYLPGGVLGFPYSTPLSAIGGTLPYHWSATGVPPGLTMAEKGALSGTPSSVYDGTLSGFVQVTVNDSSTPPQSVTQKYNFVVEPALVPTITTTSLPPGTVGVPYSQGISVGRDGQGIWTISEGSLPDGLILHPPLAAPTASGITGTPTKAGAFTFTVQCTNGNQFPAGPVTQVATQPMTIVISPSPTPIITTTNLPTGYVGVSYSATLSATGGTPPYKWTASSLPGGLTLSSAGAVSGTPNSTGRVAQVTVQDSSTPALSSTVPVNFTFAASVPVPPPDLTVTTKSLPAGTVGTYYSQPLTASGGTSPYTWALMGGVLPPSLMLDPVTGVIMGMPMEGGVFNSYSVQVTDSRYAVANSYGLSLVINGAPPTGAISRVGVFSQVAAGGGWKTSLYLVNPASAPVRATVNFWADGGGVLPFPMTVTQAGGTQTLTAATFTTTIGANATVLIESAPSSSALAGWAEVLSASAVTGYGVFHYTSRAGVESEGTVPLDNSTSSILLLPYEAKNAFGMGVALANLSADYAATNSALVWDEDGNILSGTEADLTANGHSSFMLADKIPAVTAHRGYLQLTSTVWADLSGPNIAGLGLRVNPAGGFTSTMPLNVATPVSLEAAAVFSHVAAGAGWKTSLYLVNALNDASSTSSDSSGSTVSFYGDDGTPLTLPLRVTQSGTVQTLNAATVTINVGPSSTALVEIASDSPTALSGWARVQIFGTTAGYGVFHYTSPAGVESEGTVPLDFNNGSSFLLPYDCTNGFGMGIAIAVVDQSVSWGVPAKTPVTVTLVDENGVSLPGTSFTLPAYGHTSFMLTDKIPSAAGNRGFLQFTATPTPNAEYSTSTSSTITGIGLRVNPVGGFTSVPKLQ